MLERHRRAADAERRAHRCRAASHVVVALLVLVAATASAPPGAAGASQRTEDANVRRWNREQLDSLDADLRAARATGKPYEEIQVLKRGGKAHEYFDETAPAIALDWQALGVARKAKLQGWASTILSDLAAAHERSGEGTGIAFLKEQNRKAGSDHVYQAAALKALAGGYYERDDFARAIDSGKELVALQRRDANGSEEMEARSELAQRILGIRATGARRRGHAGGREPRR